MWSLYFILLIISLVLYWFVVPLLNFSDWISWWKDAIKQPGQNYDCIDMYALAYYMSGSSWVYNLYKANQNILQQFKTEAEAEFIMSMLMTNSTAISPTGGLGPREMCYSIVPTGRQYTYPDLDKLETEWRQLVGKWCGIPDITVFSGDGSMKEWENVTSQNNGPDVWINTDENFLFQKWGIPMNSPLVVSFVTNWTNSDPAGGVVFYALPLKQLLSPFGSIGDPGGWVGMLRTYVTEDVSIADIERFIWQEIPPPWYDQNKKAQKCQPSSVYGDIVSGGTTMMGAIGAGAMVGGPFGAFVGGLIGTVLTIFQFAPKKHCDNPS